MKCVSIESYKTLHWRILISISHLIESLINLCTLGFVNYWGLSLYFNVKSLKSRG